MMPGAEIAVVARPTRSQLMRLIRTQTLAAPSTRLVVLMGLVGAPILALLYGMMAQGRPLPMRNLLLVWAVGVAYSVFLLFGAPALSLRTPASRELLEYGARYRFSDQSVFLRGANATSDVQWTAFTGASRLGDCYALRLGTGAALVVPKEAFGSAEEEQSFVALVREKLGARAKL
jgi:hypothetical protein